MIVPVFSIRDKLTGFSWPTVDTNEDTAKRNFAYAINQPGNSMYFSPGDFDLYKVGEWDTVNGIMNPTKSGIPEFVISGTNVFGKKAEDVSS